MLLLALIAIAVGLAGGSPRVEHSAQPSKACTEIGCTSSLLVDLGGLPFARPNVARVKICIQDRCRVLKRKSMKYSFRVIRAPLKPGRHKVTYVARGRLGRVLAQGSTQASSQRFQPNGPDCPPVCFEFDVRFWPDGRFTEIVPTI